MKTKSERQKYIDEHIKSIVVERHGNRFYGTLTDNEGRTFEFSKDVSVIERHFFACHREIPTDNEIMQQMLLKQFEIYFVGIYQSRRAFGNLEYSTI